MSIELRKNLLIVCEGTLTEPNYLHDIRDKIISNNIKYTIEIRPKLTKEILEVTFKLRSGVKKRIIKNAEVKVDDLTVEDKYKAQPVRYVREAQLGLIDDTYDEAWAVFDKDQHPNLKEAFELASENTNAKQVNIAFSSISFEVWVLMHFELNRTAFIKVACRNQNVIFNCGTNTHTEDCVGNICVTGYVKGNNYLSPDKNIKAITFGSLEDKVHFAIENAYILRQESFNSEIPIYDKNPFTTIDRLVFKLLNLPINYEWIDLNSILVQGIKIDISNDTTTLKITIKSNKSTTFILLPNHITLLNAHGSEISIVNRSIIGPNEEQDHLFDISILNEFRPLYIAFKISDSNFYISELPITIFQYQIF